MPLPDSSSPPCPSRCRLPFLKGFEHTATIHQTGILASVAFAILTWSSHRLTSPALLGCLLATLAVTWSATFRAVFWASRYPNRLSMPVVLAYALLFRAIGFFAEPVLENDHYRFLWDGRVFAERGSPYGVAPAEFFPRQDLGDRFDEVLSQIAYPQIPTVYGPTLEFAFLASYGIAPGELWPLKGFLIVSELLAWFFLRRWMDPVAQVLWLWCPLLIHETAFSAHPDAIGLAAMAAAIVAHHRSRPLLGGFLLAIAVGARPFAVLILPLLPGRRVRASLLGFVPTLVLLHGPFLFVDSKTLDGWSAFAAGWEFNSSGFAILQSIAGTRFAKTISGTLYLVAYLALVIGWRRRLEEPNPLKAPGDSVFASLFLSSPVFNSWYAQWLVPFVAARRRPWSIALLGMVSLSYLTEGNLGMENAASFNHPPWVRPIEFGLVLAVAAAFGVASRGFPCATTSPP